MIGYAELSDAWSHCSCLSPLQTSITRRWPKTNRDAVGLDWGALREGHVEGILQSLLIFGPLVSFYKCSKVPSSLEGKWEKNVLLPFAVGLHSVFAVQSLPIACRGTFDTGLSFCGTRLEQKDECL